MDLKNRISEIPYILKQKWLNFYSHFKKYVKKFIYKHIIAIYLIGILLIILFVNVSIRNKRIYKLELKVNELEFEKNYIGFALEDSKNQ